MPWWKSLGGEFTPPPCFAARKRHLPPQNKSSTGRGEPLPPPPPPLLRAPNAAGFPPPRAPPRARKAGVQLKKAKDRKPEVETTRPTSVAFAEESIPGKGDMCGTAESVARLFFSFFLRFWYKKQGDELLPFPSGTLDVWYLCV